MFAQTSCEELIMFVFPRGERSLSTIRLFRATVLLLAVIVGVFVFMFGESRWPYGGSVHKTIEFVGFCLLIICILGRTWCSLYIGGQEDKNLITIGPYSVSRNPLYFFSTIGAFGFGAQLGSLSITLAIGGVTWVIFYVLIFSEERTLLERFGVSYRNYLAQVPRFFPKPSIWRDIGSATIKTSVVKTTFIDACVFLVSIPLAEGLGYLHNLGFVPVFFQAP
jgi:protein-S-isoprenylcysteine O-methyltransferase Ste14